MASPPTKNKAVYKHDENFTVPQVNEKRVRAYLWLVNFTKIWIKVNVKQLSGIKSYQKLSDHLTTCFIPNQEAPWYNSKIGLLGFVHRNEAPSLYSNMAAICHIKIKRLYSYRYVTSGFGMNAICWIKWSRFVFQNKEKQEDKNGYFALIS